jgi:hypothetical protein
LKYAVFTNDVGPNAYSRFCDVEASNDETGLQKAAARVVRFAPVKVLALPHNVKLLWPDGQTGKVKRGVAEKYGAVLQNIKLRKF